MSKKLDDTTTEATSVEESTVQTEVTAGDNSEAKRARKLEKEINYDNATVVLQVVGGEKGQMIFDFNQLPDEIKAKLGPFGLGHKLGDAAAGKTGTDAEEAIEKVFEGLMKADWTVRAPAAPKMTKKDIMKNLENLPAEAREQALAGLRLLGINI